MSSVVFLETLSYPWLYPIVFNALSLSSRWIFLQVYFCWTANKEDGLKMAVPRNIYLIQNVNLCLSRISPYVRESKTGSEILDSRFGSLVGSELLELYSGFQSPGFRILVRQGKISRILKYRFPYLRWGEGGGGEEGGRWTRIRSILNNEAKKVWPARIRCSFTRSGHEVVATDNQGFCRTTIRITKIDHKWSPTTILKMDKPKMTPDLIWLTPLMISTFLLSDHRIKTWSYPRVYFLYWLLWPQFFWCRGRLQRLEIDLGAGRPVGATDGIFMYRQIVHPVAKTEYGRVIT